MGRAGRAMMVGLAVLVPIAAAAAPVEVPASLGPLRTLLPLGPELEGTWLGVAEDGWYVLKNHRKPAAVRYFYAAFPAVRHAAVKVTVQGESGQGQGEAGAAGLVYGVEGKGKTYCAVMLRADRTVALYRRDDRGLQPLMAVAHAAVRADGANELSVSVRDGRTEAAVNGAPLATLGSAVCAGPGAGIIAVGTGRFGFSDFQVR